MELLEGHYQALCRWNRVLNLTALRDEQEVVERHYGESLFLGMHLPDEAISVVDVGSGAGFPGFPVSVARPNAAVTLVEAHQRKAVFLREAARNVANVRVLALRAELLEGGFDWVISRAVKYEEVRPVASRVGERVALLVGDVGMEELAGFEWQPPIRLPWGEQRFLLLGRNVSRGT
ncbi:MAG TPA: 16S rRNA (guanine(527)-N(7))-methyltransferase RsmG [Bryobacteraceae bacterium]|nr:16S rRNA (guanine(527)-N(7))-methyltransferase RsmG [Bryobacteraceae bacterium]